LDPPKLPKTLAAAQAECNDFASGIAIQKDLREKHCTTRRANEAPVNPWTFWNQMPIREENGPIT